MSVNKQNWRNTLKQCLLLNFAATIISFAFNVAADGARAFNLNEFLASFIHSNCIGPFVWLVVFNFSPKWSKDAFFLRLFKVAVSIFIATAFGVFLTYLVFAILNTSGNPFSLIPSWERFLFAFSMSLTFGFGVYFYEISQAKLRQKIGDEEKAKMLATEAQLASLESRIHPHFLFNTLNSIASLIRENPILAETMVEKLSALLRYSLDSNAKNLVSLEQELEITEKYLEIEKVRFDKRLNYKIECEPQFFGTKLPPLSLQTLVENSIKHVVSNTSEQTEIIVSVKENGANIEIKVCDNGTGFDESALKENHGLDNLRKRLQTIFEGNASLQIIANQVGCVILQLPKG